MAVPCALIIAKDLSVQHAMEIVGFIDKLPLRVIRRAFCYKVRSSTYDSPDGLKHHQESPMLGSSLGLRNGKSSFSAGLYVRLSTDNKKYCISVHHGISNEKSPITPQSQPQVKVQQPSFPDHTDLIESLETLLQGIDEGSLRYRHRSRTATESWLKEIKTKQTDFGTVQYSEMAVRCYEGRKMNVDWALIETEESRPRLINHFRYNSSDPTVFIPRDSNNNVYVTGIGSMDMGMVVLKSGRTTGTTKAEIDFIYAHAKIDEDQPVTSEYTVVSGSNHRFSDLGDSGGPVIDEANRVVGIILGGTQGEPLMLKGHEHLDHVFATYVSPIQMIMDRIESVTGEQVLLDMEDLNDLEGSFN